MSTALEAISTLVVIPVWRSSDWFMYAFAVAAGISLTTAAVLSSTRLGGTQILLAAIVMGLTGLLGAGVMGGLDIDRKEVALDMVRRDACPIAMAGIATGEIKALRQADADKLARECGKAAFLTAINTNGSRIRLASN